MEELSRITGRPTADLLAVPDAIRAVSQAADRGAIPDEVYDRLVEQAQHDPAGALAELSRITGRPTEELYCATSSRAGKGRSARAD